MNLPPIRPYLPTAAMALLIGYFMFHALVGDRGLLNAHSRSKLLAARKLELAAAVRERQDLERQTQLMRIGSVSADLVEERARAMLGYSDPRDYVIRPTS